MVPSVPLYDLHRFAPRRHAYCIIVGVLNEGDKFRAQLARMQPWRDFADILIADGGSTDGATDPGFLASQAQALLIKKEKTSGGLSAQYRMAFHFALEEGYEGVIMVDGNNKDGMEAIPRFIEALAQGASVVQGSRFVPGGHHAHTPLNRELSIKCLFNPIMRLGSGFAYTDGINGFKAFHRDYLLDPRVQPFREVFRHYNLQYYLIYRAPRLGLKVREVPVSRVYPAQGPTPTKIAGLQGRLSILRELICTVAGRYNP